MKKVILSVVLLAGIAQAADVVHYDTKDTKKPSITKPNHPTTGLYK